MTADRSPDANVPEPLHGYASNTARSCRFTLLRGTTSCGFTRCIMLRSEPPGAGSLGSLVHRRDNECGGLATADSSTEAAADRQRGFGHGNSGGSAARVRRSGRRAGAYQGSSRHSSQASMWWPYGRRQAAQTRRWQIAHRPASSSAIRRPHDAQESAEAGDAAEVAPEGGPRGEAGSLTGRAFHGVAAARNGHRVARIHRPHLDAAGERSPAGLTPAQTRLALDSAGRLRSRSPPRRDR